MSTSNNNGEISVPLTALRFQVKVYDLSENKHGPDDVLVMGTDGLWDVTTDHEVAVAVSTFLAGCDPSDPMRYKVIVSTLVLVMILVLTCVIVSTRGHPLAIV